MHDVQSTESMSRFCSSMSVSSECRLPVQEVGDSALSSREVTGRASRAVEVVVDLGLTDTDSPGQ